MGAGFTRADYERFMHHETRHSGYGDIEWETDDTKATGRFIVVSDMEHVEYLILLNQLRLSEPTLLVKLNGACLARIDINGRHRFPDGQRSSTHLQARTNGSAAPEVTTELSSYPTFSLDGYPDVDTQLKQCFRVSEQYLRIVVDGVTWTPMPFERSA